MLQINNMREIKSGGCEAPRMLRAQPCTPRAGVFYTASSCVSAF